MLFTSHAGGGFATGNQASTWFVSLGTMGILSSIIALILLAYYLDKLLLCIIEKVMSLTRSFQISL